ncbi:oxidoreductase [Paraburkholderia sediminicola]|uniref:oxidoreductase n=1 Tax=Paraburkholderia sediminicola TaxID=458836 RepID=UPI0038BC8FF4
MTTWTTSDIPAQTGKLAIVTGSTGGLGYQIALALAKAGAEVVLAARDVDKGQQALNDIAAACSGAKVRFELLDLASVASVAHFAGRIHAAGRRLDLLVNNAGVMALPDRKVSADNLELQFATNHLGHFALTARLLPLLRGNHGARVVSMSSLAHRQGHIDFGDLQSTRAYHPWKAYSQSKLANLLFTRELQRRSDAAEWGLLSYAAHPGSSRTDLVANGPGKASSVLMRLATLLEPLMSQSAADGALPALYAATSPAAAAGAYYGPDGFYEMKGPPSLAKIASQGLDPAAAVRLWDCSNELTGVSWD